MLVNTWASSHRYLTKPGSWPNKLSVTHSLPNTLWHTQVTQRRGHSRPEHTILGITDTAFHQFPHDCPQSYLHTTWEKMMREGKLTWGCNGVLCRKGLRALHPHSTAHCLLLGRSCSRVNHRAHLCRPAWPLLKCSCPNTPAPGARWWDPAPIKGRCLFTLLLI